MHHSIRSTARRQAGSVLVNATIALSLLVIVLVGTELGYLFFMKREYQKTADLAALAGAQQLTPSGPTTSCQLARDTAAANAQQNLASATIQSECGNWAPANSSETAPACFGTVSDHFRTTLPEINAVRVRISQAPPTLLPFFPGTRTICVQAVAALDDPVAAFTVGSRLLRLEDNTILPNLLKAVGVDLSATDFLSYKGLANTSITPSGLLKALGVPISGDIDVGTLNNVASIRDLTLGGLIDATITALQNQGGVLGVSVTVLQDLRARLTLAALQTKVQLFGNETTPGILVGLDSTGNAALNAKVDLLSLVTAGVSVANGSNLVAINNLGAAGLVQARASIVEPPSIGIGGIGTKAKTAQIRVYLRVNSSSTPILGPILDTLGTGLDIPLIIELAQSTGELTKINCQAPRHNATIAVSSSQVNLCLGRFHDMTTVKDNDPTHFFTNNNRCSPNSSGAFPDTADGVRRHQLLNVLSILPLTVRVGIPLLESQVPVETNPPLNVPSVPPDGTSMATINATTLDLAQSISNIADAIAVGILGDILGQGVTANATQREALAQSLVGTENGGRGKSITQIGNELRGSKEAIDQLNARLTTGGLGGLLGGVLQGVGNLLNGLLLDPVADLLCNLTLSPSAIHQCRVNHVRDSTIAGTSNLLSGVLSMVIDLLKPVLDLLSGIIANLLATLGLSLGQTDVSLLSVDCGVAKLVN
jgi:uncharacterized membrane protein